MPKNITGSVGQGGRNWPQQDVMTIQYLLNCVPATAGGPSPELAVDGIVGSKTIAAIRKFQTAHFPRADGRVDPGGKTLQALQQFDPYPNQPLPAGGWPGKAKSTTPGKQPQWGKTGGYKTPGDPWGKTGGYKIPGDPWGKGGWGKAGGKSGGGKSGF